MEGIKGKALCSLFGAAVALGSFGVGAYCTTGQCPSCPGCAWIGAAALVAVALKKRGGNWRGNRGNISSRGSVDNIGGVSRKWPGQE